MVVLPEPFASIPRQPLLFPSPPIIEALDRLTEHLIQGSESHLVRVYVSREDVNSGLGGGGGNKLRKLEYVLADATAQSPRPTHLVTEGGVQSNHVRQVAAAAAKLGFKAVLQISDLVPERSAASDVSLSRDYKVLGNMQLTHLMSATHQGFPGTSTKEIPDNGYWIPSGASTHPLGGLGYARWAFEILEKEREMDVFFSTIVVAMMSGSTIAGMAAGFKLADRLRSQNEEAVQKRRLIGVAAGPKEKGELVQLVLGIMKTTATKISLPDKDVTENDFEIDTRWNGGCYGRLDERTREHVKLAATTEGLLTDPVYSGKALTGLCEMVRAGELQGNVLFVHTGGILSLSAYPDLR